MACKNKDQLSFTMQTKFCILEKTLYWTLQSWNWTDKLFILYFYNPRYTFPPHITQRLFLFTQRLDIISGSGGTCVNATCVFTFISLITQLHSWLLGLFNNIWLLLNDGSLDLFKLATEQMVHWQILCSPHYVTIILI